MGLARRLSLVVGAATLAAAGRDRFHLLAQGNGPIGRACRSLVESSDLHWAEDNWKHAQADLRTASRSAGYCREYAGDELGGWAAIDQQRGDTHNPLRQQLRGMILPALESRILAGDTVVEIGCSNGDVLAALADTFPQSKFVGLDFRTAAAERHRLPNLSFQQGYALDMLTAGAVKGDVIFGSSTFCAFTPPEMVRYAAAIANAGFKTVIISDPMRKNVYSPLRYPGRSMHLIIGQWGHDFRFYFGRHGFKSKSLTFPVYDKHIRGGRMRRQLIRLDRA